MYKVRDDEIMHYGVLGMKWGVHKARRAAVKDAKGTLKAKYSHGEGAGVARRNAKAKNERNSKKYGEEYNKAYEKALKKYDTEKLQDRQVAKGNAKKAYKQAKSISWHVIQGGLTAGRYAAAAATVYALYVKSQELQLAMNRRNQL